MASTSNGEVALPRPPMSPTLRGSAAARGVARAALVARREGPLLLVVAVFAAGLVLLTASTQLNQDSWLMFVSGRHLLDHGLYAPDTLTALTHGARWVDQQWLAQIVFYAAAAAGGVKAAMLLHFALLAGAFAFALAVARKRGATALAVAWIGVLAVLVAPWGWQMRTQNLAYPLYVALLAVLLRDREGPTRRTFVVIPLLILWANLHGSVLMGALIVCLYAATHAAGAVRRSGIARDMLLRCGALGLLAAGSVFASPYGLSLVHYYRSLLGNSDIKLIQEWRPAFDFAAEATAFFAMVAICVGLVAWRRSRLTAFEILLLLATALAGFQAVRNIVWFDYAALMIVPVALTGTRVFRPHPDRLPTRLFPILGIALAGFVAFTAVSRSDGWYEHDWNPAAAARVAAVVHAKPATRVWANEIFADWLLWRQPSLAGHIAYDARFEILPHRYFEHVASFSVAKGGHWHQFVDGYDVVVLGTSQNSRQIAFLRDSQHRPVIYADAYATVLGR